MSGKTIDNSSGIWRGTSIILSSTNDSSSSTDNTASLFTPGGVSVEKTLNCNALGVNTTIHAGGLITASAGVTISSGSLLVSTGSITASLNPIVAGSSNDSTSASTGAIHATNGGIGCNKSMWAGGVITSNSSTAASSSGGAISAPNGGIFSGSGGIYTAGSITAAGGTTSDFYSQYGGLSVAQAAVTSAGLSVIGGCKTDTLFVGPGTSPTVGYVLTCANSTTGSATWQPASGGGSSYGGWASLNGTASLNNFNFQFGSCSDSYNGVTTYNVVNTVQSNATNIFSYIATDTSNGAIITAIKSGLYNFVWSCDHYDLSLGLLGIYRSATPNNNDIDSCVPAASSGLPNLIVSGCVSLVGSVYRQNTSSWSCNMFMNATDTVVFKCDSTPGAPTLENGNNLNFITIQYLGAGV